MAESLVPAAPQASTQQPLHMSTPDPTPESDNVYEDSNVLSPNYRMERASEGGTDCIKLYMQTFNRPGDNAPGWRSSPEDKWPLVSVVRPGRLEFSPVFSNPHAQRYLLPKHGAIGKLVYLDKVDEPLPEDADVNSVLRFIDHRLPWGLFVKSEHGFGLEKELAEVWTMLSSVRPKPALVIEKEGQSRMDGDTIVVSEDDLDSMRRAMNRIDRRKRDGVRMAKRSTVFNQLLTKLEPTRFMRAGPGPAQPSTAQEAQSRPRRPNPIERRASRASVAAVRENLPLLASDAPAILMELRAEIERVTLAEMIARYSELLAQDLPEPRWQAFFEGNVFVLSLVFSRRVSLLHAQFHAQGSTIAGSGAQIGDFLFRETGQGLAIVEIKKPGCELVRGTPYRNTEVYAPSAELGGAVAQTLLQQSHLRSNWLVHRSRAELSQSMPEAIKCVVIAGRLPAGEAQRRSFEVFRNACKDVEIVTFDELLDKLRLLLDHLSPASNLADDIPF